VTVFFGLASAAETNVGMPGAAPSTTAGMQGNTTAGPFPTPSYPPTPQSGGAGQVLGTPDISSQLATGAIPANGQPTNAATLPGTDSILAQICRGQLSLNQSNYGQGAFLPANGGQSPQGPQPGNVNVASVQTGASSTVTFASPYNSIGN
jgi:hypothetical protein